MQKYIYFCNVENYIGLRKLKTENGTVSTENSPPAPTHLPCARCSLQRFLRHPSCSILFFAANTHAQTKGKKQNTAPHTRSKKPQKLATFPPAPKLFYITCHYRQPRTTYHTIPPHNPLPIITLCKIAAHIPPPQHGKSRRRKYESRKDNKIKL